MNRRMLTRLALCAAALAVALCGTSLAADYGYKIDVNAMKAAEAASPFPVRVIEKKVVEECLETESLSTLDDALIVTVQNDTDATLSAVTLCFVAYDEDETTQNVTSGGYIFSSSSASPQINTLTREGLSVAPGETMAFTAAVDYGKFVGARAMVARYTAADGTVIENPDFAAWQSLAFGLNAGASTVLD